MGDDGFQTRPETQRFHGEVEPAGGDAEVHLMGGHVVHPVVPAGQDQVVALQELDPGGKPKVGVGPLVELVGQRDKDGQQEEEAVPGVVLLDGLRGAAEEDEGLRDEADQGHHAVVAVGLDHVVPGDGSRVNVVLPEWSDESLYMYTGKHKSKHQDQSNVMATTCTCTCRLLTICVGHSCSYATILQWKND